MLLQQLNIYPLSIEKPVLNLPLEPLLMHFSFTDGFKSLRVFYLYVAVPSLVHPTMSRGLADHVISLF